MGKSEALPVGEHTLFGSETFLFWDGLTRFIDYQPGPICRETTCVGGIFGDFGTSKA